MAMTNLSTLPEELFTQIITHLASLDPLTIFTSQLTSRRFRATIRHLLTTDAEALFSGASIRLLQPLDPALVPRDPYGWPLPKRDAPKSNERKRGKRTWSLHKWKKGTRSSNNKGDDDEEPERGIPSSSSSIREKFGFLFDPVRETERIGVEAKRHPLNVSIEREDYFRCMPWAVEEGVRDRYTRSEANWRGIPVFSCTGEEQEQREEEEGDDDGKEEEKERGILGWLGTRRKGTRRRRRMVGGNDEDDGGRYATSSGMTVQGKEEEGGRGGVKLTAIRYIDVLQSTVGMDGGSLQYWGRVTAEEAAHCGGGEDTNEKDDDHIRSSFITLGKLWDLMLWDGFPSFHGWELLPGHSLDLEGDRWRDNTMSGRNIYRKLEDDAQGATLLLFKQLSCVSGEGHTRENLEKVGALGFWNPVPLNKKRIGAQLGEPQYL